MDSSKIQSFQPTILLLRPMFQFCNYCGFFPCTVYSNISVTRKRFVTEPNHKILYYMNRFYVTVYVFLVVFLYIQILTLGETTSLTKIFNSIGWLYAGTFTLIILFTIYSKQGRILDFLNSWTELESEINGKLNCLQIHLFIMQKIVWFWFFIIKGINTKGEYSRT